MVSDFVCVGVDCWDGSGSHLGRLVKIWHFDVVFIRAFGT